MLLEYLVGFTTEIISIGDYGGIFILMALESMIAPVPSEVVMPFAGFLVAQGRFTAEMVVISATLGSIAGSLASYYIGLYGGRDAVVKYGGYILIHEKHLFWTEKWFGKYGGKAIFASRFIPVVRHLISIPAGVGKMNKTRFVAYTCVGAAMWNAFLMYVGIKLNDNWEIVSRYSEKLDIVAIIVMVLLAGFFFIKYRKAGK